jgi:hypothetical protein
MGVHLSLPVPTSPTSTEQFARQAMLLMLLPKRASAAGPSSCPGRSPQAPARVLPVPVVVSMLRMQALPLTATASRPCGIWHRPVGELSRACWPGPLRNPGWPSPPASTVQLPAGWEAAGRGAPLCSALQACTSRACAAKQAEWLSAHLHPHPFAGRHVQLSRQRRLQMGSHHRLGILSVHSAAAAPPGCGLATPRFGHGIMHALRGRPGRHQQGSGRTVSWLHCIINSEVMEPASVAILCLCRGFHTTSAAAPSVQLVPAARAALPPSPPPAAAAAAALAHHPEPWTVYGVSTLALAAPPCPLEAGGAAAWAFRLQASTASKRAQSLGMAGYK